MPLISHAAIGDLNPPRSAQLRAFQTPVLSQGCPTVVGLGSYSPSTMRCLMPLSWFISQCGDFCQCAPLGPSNRRERICCSQPRSFTKFMAQSESLVAQHRDIVLNHLEWLGLRINLQKSVLSPRWLTIFFWETTTTTKS